MALGDKNIQLASEAVRIMRTASLADKVANVRYVNDAREGLLAKLGIYTVGDLLMRAPHRYLDFSNLSSIAASQIGFVTTIVATVDEIKVKQPKPKMNVLEISALDATGVLQVTFFGQTWLAEKFKKGDKVAFSGKVGFSYGFKRMSAPYFEILSSDEESADASSRLRVMPIHHVTEGLSSAWYRRIVSCAIADYSDVVDYLPADLRCAHGLMSRGRALRAMHFPFSMKEAEEARRRLAYDEVLTLQLGLIIRRDRILPGVAHTVHEVDGMHLAALRISMPFEMSHDQTVAIDDILRDMSSARQMNRLILGDVGTGKTAVALHALAVVADSGTQAALMAPTGVLASQYATKSGPLLDEAGVRWALLTGATPAGERKVILDKIATGQLDVLIGTHALIQPDVVFKNLSLVVVDEQHRFGVGQRSELRSKGPGADLLIMTATPIPRTLALSVYGDLDCSYLSERPVAGAGIDTKVLAKTNRPQAYDAIREAVAKGQQGYVICPLVGVKSDNTKDPEIADKLRQDLEDGEEVTNLKAAQVEYEILQNKVFPDYKVGLLTGRMKPAEKDKIMDDFRFGKIDILVATTVVEVGIDVPNATVMMIEDAERFGLSQLHQLRGRVGRGKLRGQVFLVADSRSKNAKDRLSELERTSDGYELAEFDLKMRREGEILGYHQSGKTLLRLVDLSRDIEIVEAANGDAAAFLANDPGLSSGNNELLKMEVIDRYGDVFSEVSGG